ncbi:MAG: cyclic pyranopterin monophosphate synthase MoaC [Bacteroidales bacterium]|jgi:cyclic pyranopterin phosphate synthase|nr:cyclic pyranopterin monophosphate synthase MoaC [Bacteroidales bacterium]
MKDLTHTDKQGKAVMVDVGDKDIQTRIAKAQGHIRLNPETIILIHKNQLKKGDVMAVARIAGINAAKETGTLIPLCHNIALENIRVDLTIDTSGIAAESEIRCTGKTGVEMEALTAVSIALLTVYDMCKAVDKNMVIDKIELTEKLKK